MNFIKTANLPDKKVKCVVCDSRVDDLITNEIEKSGITIVKVNIDERLDEPVAAHPDLHLFHFGGGNFLTTNSAFDDLNSIIKKLSKDIIDCEIFNNRRVPKELNREYPCDVLLNAASVGDILICNAKTISEEILNNTEQRIIHVNQGYTKCSTLIVNSSAIITEDVSIFNAVKKVIDVLLINRGEVKLKGYNYGFIGGCSGKLSKDTLAFYGNLKLHSSYNDIVSFCLNHRVNCVSLSDKPLYDYGSLLPILEE